MQRVRFNLSQVQCDFPVAPPTHIQSLWPCVSQEKGMARWQPLTHGWKVSVKKESRVPRVPSSSPLLVSRPPAWSCIPEVPIPGSSHRDGPLGHTQDPNHNSGVIFTDVWLHSSRLKFWGYCEVTSQDVSWVNTISLITQMNITPQWLVILLFEKRRKNCQEEVC